jgi:hypothetical protein
MNHSIKVPQDLNQALALAERIADPLSIHPGACQEAAQVIRNLVAELQILHGSNVDHEVLVLARVYEQVASDTFANSYGGNMGLYRAAILKLIKGGQ